MPTTINLVTSEELWDNFIERHYRAGKLLSVSSESSDCRVYEDAKGVAKIRRLTSNSAAGRRNTLEGEGLILQRLSTLGFVPKVLRYESDGSWELLELTRLSSLPTHDPTFGAPLESPKEFVKLALAVLRLNLEGCAHGDLRRSNCGISGEGDVVLYDFDQASIAHPLRCIAADFFGIQLGDLVSHHSLLMRMREVVALRWIPRLLAGPRLMLRAVRTLLFGRPKLRRPEGLVATAAKARLRDNGTLVELVEVWDKAAASNASSPGLLRAYYSLDILGVGYPGERPWVLRWNMIRKNVDFTGKRFLELGCNMGLLAIHARASGASACLGLDIDPQIVDAARAMGRLTASDVRFEVHNLDASEAWEEKYANFDVISALSVVHWVSDKNRLWRFLSGARELLYEGHESDADAEARLGMCGFVNVRRLGATERGRSLYLATKD